MRRKTTEQFIEEAKKVHGDRYDYSLVEYKGDKIKVLLICEHHGTYLMRPDHHLRGINCPECKRVSLDEFIKRSSEIHNNFYDYSLIKELKGVITSVPIICPIHNIFNIKACAHLRGNGCIRCRDDKQRLTIAEFIERSKKIHGNKYDYSHIVNYVNNRTKVPLVCDKHGFFEIEASGHMQGRGCRKCGFEKLGTSFTAFGYRNKNKVDNTTLYLIEIFDDLERFLKVGIAKDGVYERFKKKRAMPYAYEGLLTYIVDVDVAFDIEKRCGSAFKKYDPIKRFSGRKECFDISEKSNIIKYLENAL